jgi:hypothetical protein
MIEICLRRIKLYCYGEIIDSRLVVTLSVIRDSSVVVGVGIFRVDFDCHGVVTDCGFEVVEFIVGETSVE